MNSNDLSALDSAVLTRRIDQLVHSERACLVDFLRHLAELERRGAHLELGFSSIFVYCRDHLRLSKGASFRRMHGAALLTKFPVAADYLADGRLNLTTLVALREVLTTDNHREVLDGAAGRSEEEVELIVARLQPRPDVRQSIRRLPVRTPSAEPVSPLTLALSPSGEREVAKPTPPPAPARIEALREDRFAIHLSVSAEFREDLNKVKSALSHRIPDGNLEEVLHECLRLALKKHAQSKGLSTKPKETPKKDAVGSARNQNPENPTRHIRAAVMRAVWQRDAGRCAFTSADGRRCNSTHQVEVHHLEPFALGGPPTVDNLSLRCSRHNRYHAIQDFGAEKMQQFQRVR